MSFAYTDVRHALRDVLGPGAIDGLRWYLNRNDWRGVQRIGEKLGNLAFQLARKHRNAALSNIHLVFGDSLDGAGVEAMARGVLRNVTTLFVEALRLADMSRDELAEICTISGEDYLQEALSLNRGVVLFSGHLGNWEVGAVRLIHAGYPLQSLSRPPRSPRLAHKFQEIRAKQNFPVIPVSSGMRGILRALESNCIVPIMPDRFAKGHGVTVPFFGRDTHIWQTPALVASRTGCPVIPCHSIRQDDGSFVVKFSPMIEFCSSDDRRADLLSNTARCMAVLEREVRETPEQYAWHYKLWRDLENLTSAEGQVEFASELAHV